MNDSLVKVVIWLFTITLFGVVNNTSASLVDKGFHTIRTVDTTEKGCYIASADLPVLPEAELLSGSTLMQHVLTSRLQRLQLIKCNLFLKSVLKGMANYISVLTMHQDSIYSSTISHYCEPPNLYYVFTLRHIVI